MPASTLSLLPGCLKEKINPLLKAIETGSKAKESETSEWTLSIFVSTALTQGFSPM